MDYCSFFHISNMFPYLFAIYFFFKKHFLRLFIYLFRLRLVSVVACGIFELQHANS